jgi:nucleoside-diphosphate-sugar epimerase
MRVLVTGASGFIGQHTCRELLIKGYEVIGISRSSRQQRHHLYDDGPKQHFDEHYLEPETLQRLQMNFCDITTENDKLISIFEKAGHIDCVFHLAGQPYRRDSDSPEAHTYFQSNFMGTLNILECSRIFDIKRFVFSSTYLVYGLGIGNSINNDLGYNDIARNRQYYVDQLPVKELHIVRPFNFYETSKYHAEQLCKYYHDRFAIPLSLSILRYSKVFGPGLKEGVVYEMMHRALLNLPICICGDIGTDFVFVNDVAKANLAAFDNMKNSHNKNTFETYNIGTGKELTLRGLCSKIIKLTHSKSKLEYLDKPKSHLSLDISKAKTRLGYCPIPIEEGLLRYKQWLSSL